MSFTLEMHSSQETVLNAWSELPDIDMVSDTLSIQDQTFLDNVGRLLATAQQTSRFAITLLHSHFEASAEECLVERYDLDSAQIITDVKPLHEVQGKDGYIVNSWMFRLRPPEGQDEPLQILTWSRAEDVPVAPLSQTDSHLLEALAREFRAFDVASHFGMALVGRLADEGTIWTEGTDFLGRRLVSAQEPTNEVMARNPIMTVWVFDPEGRSLKTRGCCNRYQNGSHSGKRHPNG